MTTEPNSFACTDPRVWKRFGAFVGCDRIVRPHHPATDPVAPNIKVKQKLVIWLNSKISHKKDH